GPRCSPVVDGDRVYAYGADGMLYCLSVLDGQELWRVDTVKQFGVVQLFFGVGSTPVVEGELLSVVVGGSPAAAEGHRINLDFVEGNGTGIVAFDKFTGAVRYALSDQLASYATAKLATIGDRRWGFAFCRGALVGFDPANGKIDFEFPWKAKFNAAVSAATPVVVDDHVFISESYGPGGCLLKVRPGGCDVVWQDELRKREKAMQTHWNTPVYHDGYLYASSGRHSSHAELRCIEWKTGRIMWSELTQSRSSFLFVDDHFVVLGEYGQLMLVKANPKNFEPVAAVTLREDPRDDDSPQLLKYPAWSAPVLSHGLLYVRGKDRLVCLELIPED
ncbi:MAG: PQQ-binding-like beta-propeller repeat protein, partial [Planctomycetes bacterium]|nr:PQQ-binding-like beta-propeller repeat protein [Planctomycetota bacterium]